MDQSAAIAAARFFGQRLSAGAVRVSKLILFGSHSRGDAGEDSDVDILVISADFRGKDIFARAALIRDSERETIRRFLVPLDVLMMAPEEFEGGASLMAQAAQTGMILYSDEPQVISEIGLASQE